MPELPPHYYRDNFLHLLDAVESQYGDIFQQQEQDFLATYRSLSFDAQCLYVRLVSRVGPWFRESQLAYPELASVADALDELVETGMALQPVALSADELGKLCTRQELLGIFDLPRGAKAEVLAILEARSVDLLAALGAHETRRVIGPDHLATVDLLQLLFFGNRYQGMTDFVLSDLGVARYYPYSLDRSQRYFPGRAELEEYLAGAEQSDLWYQLQDEGDVPGMLQLASDLVANPPRFETSRGRWYRLCNRLARQLEREGEEAMAMGLYQVSQVHPARERLARLLERAGQYTEALTLCQLIAEAPWCEEERDAARRITPRLQRKLQAAPIQRQRDVFSEITLTLDRQGSAVELQVASALSAQWQGVYYVENQLMNTLFGLAFWEQIFAPVPGAFNNPFQSVPADMYERTFTTRRQESIATRLQQLEHLDLAEELSRCWQAYQGYQCRWVNWKYVDETLVSAAARIIPSPHLLGIWRRMLFDPRENRRGFPDLLALGEAPGDYQMIEVKGPGDALQESQKRWLRFFGQADIPARVVWVQWADD